MYVYNSPSDKPYALESQAERQNRLARRSEVKHAALTQYIERIRVEMGPAFYIPYTDTLDGGINSRLLILMEAPGPQAVTSGFVSRNNPDPTARNLCELLAEAKISRHDTLIWNIVPWYVGDSRRIRAVCKADYEASSNYVRQLLNLLQSVQVIVLLGKKAQRGFQIAAPNYCPIVAPHPSQVSLNIKPSRREEILLQFREVARRLSGSPES